MDDTNVKHNESDVRALRLDIDVLVRRLDNLFSSSRELSLVKTKLEEAKMWAGKELGNIGVALPPQYQDSAPTMETAEDAPAEAEEAPTAPEMPADSGTEPHVVNPDELNGYQEHVSGGVDQ